MSVPRKALFVFAVLAGCAHDPAYDRPIQPWSSPEIAPTSEASVPSDDVADASADATE